VSDKAVLKIGRETAAVRPGNQESTTRPTVASQEKGEDGWKASTNREEDILVLTGGGAGKVFLKKKEELDLQFAVKSTARGSGNTSSATIGPLNYPR